MALKSNPIPGAMPGETLVLTLISEELKSRRFFNTLAELGMDNPYYRPHLDEVILACLGLNDDSNETFDFYCSVLNEHAEKIAIQSESVAEQAGLVYKRLVDYRQAAPQKT